MILCGASLFFVFCWPPDLWQREQRQHAGLGRPMSMMEIAFRKLASGRQFFFITRWKEDLGWGEQLGFLLICVWHHNPTPRVDGSPAAKGVLHITRAQRALGTCELWPSIAWSSNNTTLVFQNFPTGFWPFLFSQSSLWINSWSAISSLAMTLITSITLSLNILFPLF